MRRLYTRIYLHFIGVLLVVGLASSLVVATGARGALVRAWTVRLTRHISWVLSSQSGDPARRRETARHTATELDLDVTVRALDGTVLTEVGAPLPAPSGPDAEAARKGAVPLERGRAFYVAAPIHDLKTHQVIALLEVRPAHRLAFGGLWRPIALVALILLVVGVGTGPLARRISRPVERLTEASRRLGGGELAYRVPVAPRLRRSRRFDELGELTRAWNEMAERVEKLVRGQRELLANVSHELRSPLQRMRVALELLPPDPSSEARRRDLQIDIGELERLIDDVLTTSRLEVTGLPMHLDVVSVDTLLGQIAERAGHDPATEGKKVALAGSASSLMLQADGALLKRALWNLVENAAKYGAPPITLAAARAGDRIAITVSDEGAGIPEADRERVLDPFVRLDRARTPGAQGVGLGLTLARRVAEVHGGAIRIDAAHPDGSGCRVTLEVPLGSG
ncbi:MAG TPA: ATP-binding protein [Polyangia bacterium]|jgi:signal transduction histidine kinase